jgi:hypothetical protein
VGLVVEGLQRLPLSENLALALLLLLCRARERGLYKIAFRRNGERWLRVLRMQKHQASLIMKVMRKVRKHDGHCTFMVMIVRKVED